MKTLTRFTQPDVLYGIGTELLTELFDRFKPDLEAKNVVIPNPNLADGHYYESVAELFKSPAALPEKLVEAVRAIEELASPENKPILETAFWESPEDLHIQPDASPEETALQIWLNSPYPSGQPSVPASEAPATSAPAEPSAKNAAPNPPSEAPPPLPKPALRKRPLLSPPVIADSGWRRQGKVARLPKEVRDKINFLLLDGLSYPLIIKALGPDGEGLNEDNISNWKLGGYVEWLTEQKDMEDMHLREEYTLQLVKENGGTSLSEATIKMATAQIRKALRANGEAVVQAAMEDNSQNYIRLVNALARLTNGAITCQDHRVKEDQRQANLEKANADPASLSLTPETLRKIEELLRLR